MRALQRGRRLRLDSLFKEGDARYGDLLGAFVVAALA